MIAPDTQPLLALRDVVAGYQPGVDILQGLTIDVVPESLTLIIGPNGAGKSTALKTIFGFLKAQSGRIALAGEELIGLAPHEIKTLGVSYVPQEINTFPLLTVEENIRMGGWTFRRDKARLTRQMERIYETFPALAQKRKNRAGELSGGQGRMLSVAREMMTEPRLLLVDEPTAGLSPKLVEQVYELLQTARRALRATILLVDQNVDDAIREADSVYLVHLGRVKADGPAGTFPPDRVSALIQECLLG